MPNKIKKIAPFLWFDNNAEDAAKFYVSIFSNSKIIRKAYYSEGMPGKAGTVMTVEFLLEGQEFVALNGGPIFKFSEAISFAVYCDTQVEIDRLWEKLVSGGGEESQCGWLKDKFGLSWQIIPSGLNKMLTSKDKEKSKRVMQAIMKMRKLDIRILKDAFKK